jgi:glycosyltransferase involved in cell wall biosynthesis
MRIAIANWNRRVVGGAESYLNEVIRAFSDENVEIAFISEIDSPSDRVCIEIPVGARYWCLSDLGEENVLDALRLWRPEVIFVHYLANPTLEARLLEIAPSVLFAHGYGGMCISGEKTFKNPEIRPCNRRFGWECLLQFYPRRCGGLSPITMWRDYTKEKVRLSLLQKYAAIITASEHMRRELLAHGLPNERVRKISLPISTASKQVAGSRSIDRAPGSWRLLFIGRMTWLKGGQILIAALPIVAAELVVPINVTFAGDGPARAEWQKLATRMRRGEHRISIQFIGWMDPAGIRRTLESSDLLVVPSLWPEPFGIVGPKAGQAGVPAAAFDVGGISEWLIDGVNGFMAAGNSLSAAAIAAAIVRCLRDAETYSRLCDGARETSRKFEFRAHVGAALELFKSVIDAGGSGGADVFNGDSGSSLD